MAERPHHKDVFVHFCSRKSGSSSAWRGSRGRRRFLGPAACLGSGGGVGSGQQQRTGPQDRDLPEQQDSPSTLLPCPFCLVHLCNKYLSAASRGWALCWLPELPRPAASFPGRPVQAAASQSLATCDY